MGKRIAILQSNNIPWKGTFDLIFNEGPDRPKCMKSFVGRNSDKPVAGGT